MIPDVKPGQPITASHINRIKRVATRKHTGDGVFETDDFVVHRRIGGQAGAKLATFSFDRILDESPDVLQCKEGDAPETGVDERPDIEVLKPYDLQEEQEHDGTAFMYDAVNQERDAVKMTGTPPNEVVIREKHRVTKKWVKGDQIIAEPYSDPDVDAKWIQVQTNRVWAEVPGAGL